MPDLLDRVYDTLTQGAAVIGTALGVDMSDVIEKKPAPKGPPFRVEEVIDADTGKVAYVVTDGAGASLDAPTRQLADATLDALEQKGAEVVRSEKNGHGHGHGNGNGAGP